MSDKIEREIEEILNRIEGSAPEGDVPDGQRGLSLEWVANLHRGVVSRLAGVSRRRIMLGSLVLAVLVAAGLFFGLVYPSLGGSGTSAGSGGGEIQQESVGDRIGEADHADDTWPEDSVEGVPDSDERESEHEHEGDHAPELEEEHDGHERH